MAAFTKFSKENLERYLRMYGLGTLIEYAPISGGIDNSNYFLAIEKEGANTDFVLTIMENHSFDEAPFFGKLLMHLYRIGLPVPAPQTTLDGMTSTIFCGKPTFLVRKLPGTHIKAAGITECRTIGEYLATQHKATNEFTPTKPNYYSVEWMKCALNKVKTRLSKGDYELIKDTIEIYSQLNNIGLPQGLIHGDLFRDNALFEESRLTGVIDYYRACEDILAIDITIAINDWCKQGGKVDAAKRDAMISGYNAVRPLEDNELRYMLELQQVSAARFTLTRMLVGDPPPKDPEEMLAIARLTAKA